MNAIYNELNASQLIASAISRFTMNWAGCEPDADYFRGCTTIAEKLAHIKNYSQCAFANKLTNNQAISVMVWLDLFCANFGSPEYLKARFEDLK